VLLLFLIVLGARGAARGQVSAASRLALLLVVLVVLVPLVLVLPQLTGSFTAEFRSSTRSGRGT